MENREYKPRMIDKTIEIYLDIFPAILIEDPKWCGKYLIVNIVVKVNFY